MGFARSQRRSVPSTQQGVCPKDRAWPMAGWQRRKGRKKKKEKKRDKKYKAGGSKSWRPASERIHTVDPWGNGNNDSRSQVLQVDL